MAIAPSKLGRLVAAHWNSDDALIGRLRDDELVTQHASDGDLRSAITKARDEHAAFQPEERVFNTPEERVRVFLGPYLTRKGRAWAVPLKSLDLLDDA